MACSDSSILSTGLQNGLLTGLLTSPAICLLLIGPLLTVLPDHHDEINIRTDDVRIYTVGNMMQSVVLDGNPLDKYDGNLLDEVVLDLMSL